MCAPQYSQDEGETPEAEDTLDEDRLRLRLETTTRYGKNSAFNNYNNRNIVYIFLCLAFGVSKEANNFSLISEPVFNITNNIL